MAKHKQQTQPEVNQEPPTTNHQPEQGLPEVKQEPPFGERYFESLKLNSGVDIFAKGAWQKVFAVYLEKVFGLRGKKILDLGCGAGAVCSAFADYGMDVIGNDISEYIAKKTPFKNFKFVNSPMWDMKDIPDSSVDFVFSMYSFNHVPKDKLQKTFDEIKRVCKSEAMVFIILNMGSTINKVNELETVYPKYILDECASNLGMKDGTKNFYSKLMITVVPGWDFMRKYQWPYVIYKVVK